MLTVITMLKVQYLLVCYISTIHEIKTKNVKFIVINKQKCMFYRKLHTHVHHHQLWLFKANIFKYWYRGKIRDNRKLQRLNNNQ